MLRLPLRRVLIPCRPCHGHVRTMTHKRALSGICTRVCPSSLQVPPARLHPSLLSLGITKIHRRRFSSSQQLAGGKHAKQRKWTRGVLYVSGFAAGAYFIDEYFYASVAQRSVRAVYALTLVAYKYSNSSRYDSPEILHEECADLIFTMMGKNKGLYIKLGQAIANQGALFPHAYQARFTRLYDDAPNDSWLEIDAVLRSSLGPNYETDLFETFDHVPIASALIAQVHRATLKNSRQEVAVKVQHPYISRQIHADLAVYRMMSLVYAKVFDLPLDFATDYISQQLLKEADFTNECANSERLMHLIDGDRTAKSLNIYIPNNFPKLASSKVIVTEWINGILLTDRQRLIDAKVSLKRLMTQYTAIFAKQIFDYGFVHSDPHPGNILVRFQNGKQQLVILDHGLYIEFPQKFKDQYCSLWQNLLGFDLQKIVDLAREWGIGLPDLLRSMVQLRPPKKVKAEDAPNSTELLRMIFADKEKFPQDLLFLQRTMRMMQNLNQSMGSPINRINLLTEISLDANVRRNSSWSGLLLYVTVKATLMVSNIVFWLFRARQILLGDRYGDKGEGLEDYLDKYLKENARSLGIDFG